MRLENQYLYFKEEIFPPLPFDLKLSLDPVFQFWEKKAQTGNASEKLLAKSILDGVAHLPELRQPTADLKFIEEHSVEISSLLSAMFPEILSNNEIKAASLPFFPVLFNMTDRLRTILSGAPKDFKLFLKGFDVNEVYMLACSFLIAVYYKTPINFKRPLYFDIPNADTGIICHYRAVLNGEFSLIKPKENFKQLSPEDIQNLIDNSQDIELWKRMIPPGTYEYEGIALITLYDQSEDEALSELKQLLLTNNALRDDKILDQLQRELAQYLGIDQVEIGFEAFDEKGKNVRALYGATRPSKLLGNTFECGVGDCFCPMSTDTLLHKRECFSVSNVKDVNWAPSKLVHHMEHVGVGSFIVAPLKYNDEIIAFIEVTSPRIGVLNSMIAAKMKSVLPMFTVAVSRSIDQYETQLEAIIQDKFTSIHPTVAWKFFKAAEKIYQNQFKDKAIEVDDIQFQDVVPLYGQFDIRGSSDARNTSIQADLLYQLNLAGEVLRHALEKSKFPVYQQLLFRIEQFRLSLGESIHAGDEIKILDFIKRELDPVFDFLQQQSGLKMIVNKYREALDKSLGSVYRQRKDYEQTVTMINERISAYLGQQQVHAQLMFPHYFEKYKTDGVEYNAYIGQSLVQAAEFHPLYLKNLRLWQLLITCGVENIHQSYKHELPIPLDITSLILVHNNPLAIRFRMDEKRFDVDGAYNARYEILKKRIDKAYVKGTKDRLTQPGKLAIVFCQDWEAEEYLQYIQYLQSIDYLDYNLERLELEDLQSTTGLQAFRIGFKYEGSPDTLIQEMMQEMNS